MKRLMLLLFLAIPLHAEIALTFDDGSRTQIDNAFPLLQEFKMVGTEYIITKPLGHDDFYMNWGDVKTLSDAGWEIGAHTYTHPDLTKISMKQLRFELDQCIHDLKWHRYDGKDFAYPYGETNDRVRSEVEKRFRSARLGWSFGGVEVNNLPITDPYHITVVILTEGMDLVHLKKLIYKSRTSDKLLVFMIHKVILDKDIKELSTDKWGVSVSKLRSVLDYMKDQQVPVVTIEQALRRNK